MADPGAEIEKLKTDVAKLTTEVGDMEAIYVSLDNMLPLLKRVDKLEKDSELYAKRLKVLEDAMKKMK